MMLFYLSHLILAQYQDRAASDQPRHGEIMGSSHAFAGMIEKEYVCTKQPKYHEEESAPSLSLCLSLLCLGAVDLLPICL